MSDLPTPKSNFKSRGIRYDWSNVHPRIFTETPTTLAKEIGSTVPAVLYQKRRLESKGYSKENPPNPQ